MRGGGGGALTMTAVGVASPRAQGHATTMTLIPNSTAKSRCVCPAGSQSSGYDPTTPAKHLPPHQIYACEPFTLSASALDALLHLSRLIAAWYRWLTGVQTKDANSSAATVCMAHGGTLHVCTLSTRNAVRSPASLPVRWGGGRAAHQQDQVMNAMPSTMGTNTADTRSAKDWMGAFANCAASTSCAHRWSVHPR